MPRIDHKPSWDKLFEISSAQEGHFTTAQAQTAGYYGELLDRYLKSGRIVRIRRGIYRVVHYPPGEHEDFVVHWLWSDQVGVFSHETALALHDLSDVLPARCHMTVPGSWAKRRLRVPEGLVLYHADLDEDERAWHGAIPVTTPVRTIQDALAAHATPELIEQAVQDAVAKGLLTNQQRKALKDALARVESIER